MPPRVSEAHKATKRQAILDAASRVFIAKGFAAATMQDVIDEAGASRGGVYLYFANKEELLFALVARADEQLPGRLDALLEQHGSVWEAVSAFLDGLERQASEIDHRFAGVFYEFFVARFRDQRPFLLPRYQMATAEIAAFLQTGVTRGEFVPTVPVEAAARVLVSFLDGLNVAGLFIGGELPRFREQTAAMRVALRALLGVHS